MNPDKFIGFYEQGKSSATEDVMRKTKNIDMKTRDTCCPSKSGFQVRSVSSPSSNGLRKKYKNLILIKNLDYAGTS